VASKDQKIFMPDLKTVYQATTKDKTELELDKFNEKWRSKYAVVIKSGKNSWHKLSTYFAYDEQIRRLIYTTNAVEGFYRQVRKITMTKSAFPNDMALLKLIYLAVDNISRKWTSPLQNWALTAQQLHIKFGDRMRMDL
jgi:putative transposase